MLELLIRQHQFHVKKGTYRLQIQVPLKWSNKNGSITNLGLWIF